MNFTPTSGQVKQFQMLSGSTVHCMAYGGSRSAKTFGWVYCIVMRALLEPSTHLIVRRHFKDCRQAIAMDTFPDVMRKAFPMIDYKMNQTDWYATIFAESQVEQPDGTIKTVKHESTIWFGGLDDKDRADKVLGREYSTIFVNECSEFQKFAPIVTLRSRLAQKSGLRLKALYDQNPPRKSHWTYREFEMGIKPSSRGEKILDHEKQYASVQMNPTQNQENIAPEYIATILEGMPEKQRLRFLEGEYTDDTENALWTQDMIDDDRVSEVPGDMSRIVVSVDPAVTSNENSDETGIIVAGKYHDGHIYIMDDRTMKAHPSTWGKAAVDLYKEYSADAVIGEVNNGGDLVELNIRSAKGGDLVSYEEVRASRGKIARAEPVAAYAKRGMIHHVGTFKYLEDEQTQYTGDPGDDSPNRLDAYVWACSKLAGMDANEDNIQSILENCVMT